MIWFLLLYGLPLVVINGILLYLGSSLDDDDLRRFMQRQSVIPLMNIFVVMMIVMFLINIARNRR